MHTLDIAHHVGPILVTVVYILVYYVSMTNVARLKRTLHAQYKEEGKKFDRYFGQDRQMLAADRVQLNILEHMPPFLVLLWLVALFVGPWWATGGGVVYVVARAAYPFLMGSRLGREIRATILLATVPGYAVLLYFMVVLVIFTVLGLLPAA